MNWKASPPAIEIAAASIAAASLGGAVGFAVARIAPVGAGLVEASGAGVIAALASGLILGRIDRERTRHGFAPVESLGDLLVTEDVLWLDQRVDDDAVLLLDDPLPALDAESRVVRLFTAQPTGTAPAAAFAGPAEMVARIEDFLGQSRGSALVTDPVPPNRTAAEEASAALHSALADIRRSLRQG